MNIMLVAARNSLKLTQKEAAKIANINRSTLASLEKGGFPKLNTAYKIANAYKMSVYELFLPNAVE